MNWKKSLFANFKLYAVTDLPAFDPQIFKKVEAAYRGGADIVQLRSKSLTDTELYRVGTRFRKIARRFRKLFFVNDRLDLALALEADGVHLGQDNLPLDTVRKILKGRKLFIGRSTHSLSQALRAVKEGHDYIGVGPIFETPTKPAYRPVGLDLIRKVAKRVRLPFVVIGGIDRERLQPVMEAGAKRVAVVRAIFGTRNTFQATRALREEMDTYEK